MSDTINGIGLIIGGLMVPFLGFMVLASETGGSGIIAFFLPSIQEAIAAAGNQAIDFAYPALISAIIPKPVMGFFAAVMFGAILSSLLWGSPRKRSRISCENQARG